MRNHAYMDGNKRTALVAADMFMKINGYRLLLDEEDLFAVNGELADAQVTVVTGGWSRERLGRYFESRWFLAFWLTELSTTTYPVTLTYSTNPYSTAYGVLRMYSVNCPESGFHVTARDQRPSRGGRDGMGTWRGQYWLAFGLECEVQSTSSMQDEDMENCYSYGSIIGKSRVRTTAAEAEASSLS